MKRQSAAIAWLLLACLLCGCSFGCAPQQPAGGPTSAPAQSEAPASAAPAEPVDYAAAVQPDDTGATAQLSVAVESFVDGDTAYFTFPTELAGEGPRKGRFLAVNTPEITGKVEEYGKAAAAFTREKLESAASILLESDDGEWHLDSTGERYLVWVWYRTQQDGPYRNLNIELLQNGLGIASSSANNRYGDTCMAAIAQAKALGLNVYSGQPDPDFYYGDAVELTLRELRLNPEAYDGVKVAFSGVVTMNDGQCVYVESQDAESGLYFVLPVYYGYGLSGHGLSILKVGNEARVVGTFQFHAASDAYQVAGVEYRMMDPDAPDNLQKLSDGHQAAYTLIEPSDFASGEKVLTVADESCAFPTAELAMSTSVEVRGLHVFDAYVTDDPQSDSYGAITLLCDSDGAYIQVRLIPMHDESGDLISPEIYLDKTLDVRGIVTRYNGAYQIKVFTPSAITIHP